LPWAGMGGGKCECEEDAGEFEQSGNCG